MTVDERAAVAGSETPPGSDDGGEGLPVPESLLAPLLDVAATTLARVRRRSACRPPTARGLRRTRAAERAGPPAAPPSTRRRSRVPGSGGRAVRRAPRGAGRRRSLGCAERACARSTTRPSGPISRYSPRCCSRCGRRGGPSVSAWRARPSTVSDVRRSVTTMPRPATHSSSRSTRRSAEPRRVRRRATGSGPPRDAAPRRTACAPREGAEGRSRGRRRGSTAPRGRGHLGSGSGCDFRGRDARGPRGRASSRRGSTTPSDAP